MWHLTVFEGGNLFTLPGSQQQNHDKETIVRHVALFMRSSENKCVTYVDLLWRLFPGQADVCVQSLKDLSSAADVLELNELKDLATETQQLYFDEDKEKSELFCEIFSFRHFTIPV